MLWARYRFNPHVASLWPHTKFQGFPGYAQHQVLKIIYWVNRRMIVLFVEDKGKRMAPCRPPTVTPRTRVL